MFSRRRFQRTRQRQLESKGSAASGLRFKFYPTVVQLHKPKSVRESDTSTSRTGCKKQLENFLLIFGGDTRAGIGHGDDGKIAVAAEVERDGAAGAGEVAGVEQEIEHGLMDELAIDEDVWKFRGQVHPKYDAGFGDGGARGFQHVVQQQAQIGFFQLDFQRLGEIQERFHGAIEAVNFAIEHFHGLLRLGLDGHVGFQHFQPEAHRIQRVFYFVRDASRNAAERGEAFGNLQLVPDTFERFDVAQGDERAHGDAVLANHLGTEADALRAMQAGEGDFGIFDVADFVALDAKGFARGMAGRENFADAHPAQNFGPLAEKLFHRGAYQHGVAARVEEQQAIFQSAHHLVEILAQGAENFAHVA